MPVNQVTAPFLWKKKLAPFSQAHELFLGRVRSNLTGYLGLVLEKDVAIRRNRFR